jgi:hypothetical protein
MIHLARRSRPQKNVASLCMIFAPESSQKYTSSRWRRGSRAGGSRESRRSEPTGGTRPATAGLRTYLPTTDYRLPTIDSGVLRYGSVNWQPWMVPATGTFKKLVTHLGPESERTVRATAIVAGVPEPQLLPVSITR